MSAYYQMRRISKAFKNWKKFGVIMFGSLFLASNVAALPVMAAVDSSATYEVYIDTNASGAMQVGSSRTFNAQAVLGFGDNSDVTAQSKFNWLAINKATGQIVDTKSQVGASYVFTPSAAGDYQIRARGFLNSDNSKNAWEKFSTFVKVNATSDNGGNTGGVDDNGMGGDDTGNNGGNTGGTNTALYEVYIDTNLSNAMHIGDTRTYHAQALLGFGANSDVTNNSTFNWLAINTDTNTIVDTKQNVGSSYLFEAKAAGHYQIRARGYLNGDASKNAWEKFPAFVTVNGTTITCSALTITMNPDVNPLTLVNGVATANLTAHIEDSLGNTVIPTDLQWTVVNGGATITKTGSTTATFTTSLSGNFTVRATGFACGSPVQAQKVISVIDSNKSLSVVIDPVMPRIPGGATVTYRATASDQNGVISNQNNVTFNWMIQNNGLGLGQLLNTTGREVMFRANTGITVKNFDFIKVVATYNGLNAIDTEGADIYEVGVQNVLDHVVMTIDRNPINTNDSTLVRAQAYDQFNVAIANCSYNWNKLSGVGSIISATNLQVITFGSQSVVGHADLQVTANCFGANRSTTGTVQVVGNGDNFRVELSPETARMDVHETRKFTARAYSNNVEVTDDTDFDFDILDSDAGSITDVDDNQVYVRAGNDDDTFDNVLRVIGRYEGMSDDDRSTIIVDEDQNDDDNSRINGSIVGSLDGRGTNVCTDDMITYNVTVSNFQNGTLHDVMGSMNVPANTSLVSATSGSGNVSISGSTVNWNIGTLTNGQSKTMTVRVSVNSGFTGSRTISASFNVWADEVSARAFTANQINVFCGGTTGTPDGKGPLPSTGVEWQMIVALLAGALGLSTITYLVLRRRDLATVVNQ